MMLKSLRTIFLVHAIVAAIIGLPLLLIPGRFLSLLGWAPVEPIINRIFGAALLALAWSSFRGWRATEKTQLMVLVEMEAAFTVLGCIGIMRHLLLSRYPFVVWLTLAILALFAIAWIVSLVALKRQSD